MQSFLGELSDELIEKYGSDFTGVTVVFPTRRAGVFFRAELAKKLSKPVWAPRVLAIQDLMAELAGRSVPDAVTLLFELFDVYRGYFPNDAFDEYYPWGEVMLKDFDELDKSLAIPANVFTIIADIKEIDASFGLSEDDLERLRSFWGHYFDHDQTVLKEEFAKTWRHLKSIYDGFHERLQKKGWCTEGQAYRLVAEKLTTSDTWKEKCGKSIVFAGLYALSRSEEQVVEFLLDQGVGSIYWDADRHYIEDEFQEAGHFLRASPLFNRSQSKWMTDHLRSSPKSVEVIGIPMEVGQAKMAGHLVQQLSLQEGFSPERTAVVLPAEHLLFPVLYALPESIEKINVTMGYPLHQTPIFYLFESLIQLQTNSRMGSDASSTSYFLRDVMSVLDHPYIRNIDVKAIQTWKESISKEGSIRVKQDRLTSHGAAELFHVIFKPVKESSLLFEWCRDVLRIVLGAMDQREFKGQRLESEFIARLLAQLNRLDGIYQSVTAESSLKTWWNLFKEIICSTKIPFAGEPLQGLQVMGFLESRVLDFENVILLSVNENILPASGQHPSFIPYGIRKAFSMPTHEDQHAVTAYHFYRLLQRAKKIYLLHNTAAKSISSGEPSRFIVQLEHEIAAKYTETVQFNRRIILTPVSEHVAHPIVIEKSPEVLAKLEKWYWDGNSPMEYSPKLSPSALNMFISCPLRFYLSHVAGLWEQEEQEETMEAGTIGNVLHRAMELLYAGKEIITAQEFSGIRPRVLEAVHAAIKDKFVDPSELEGKNILLRNVIVELVHQILSLDEKDAPIHVLQLEETFTLPFAISETKTVILKGVIDRVDQREDAIRVIDYKTGKVKFRKVNEPEDLFIDSAHKEQFQTMLYAYHISKKFHGRPVKVGLITLREMSGGVKMINKGEPLDAHQLAEFEVGLRGMINRIFDPSQPFVQTDDHSQCTYCAFKDLCARS